MWSVSDDAGAFDVVAFALGVGDGPVAIDEHGGVMTDVGDADAIGPDPAGLMVDALVVGAWFGVGVVGEVARLDLNAEAFGGAVGAET